MPKSPKLTILALEHAADNMQEKSDIDDEAKELEEDELECPKCHYKGSKEDFKPED